jgi:hypothetical protein
MSTQPTSQPCVLHRPMTNITSTSRARARMALHSNSSRRARHARPTLRHLDMRHRSWVRTAGVMRYGLHPPTDARTSC